MMIVIIQENEKRIHATCGRKQYYYNFFSSFIIFFFEMSYKTSWFIHVFVS